LILRPVSLHFFPDRAILTNHREKRLRMFKAEL
jgi:hypothetical protein